MILKKIYVLCIMSFSIYAGKKNSEIDLELGESNYKPQKWTITLKDAQKYEKEGKKSLEQNIENRTSNSLKEEDTVTNLKNQISRATSTENFIELLRVTNEIQSRQNKELAEIVTAVSEKNNEFITDFFKQKDKAQFKKTLVIGLIGLTSTIVTTVLSFYSVKNQIDQLKDEN